MKTPGRYLAGRLNMDISELSFDKLRSEEIREKLGVITFVTATDGNHGRGIAWAAHQLGHKSVVFMPKGSSEIRLENIRKEGAEASITEFNYDDSVRLAEKFAREHGGVLIQDSAWEGYMETQLTFSFRRGSAPLREACSAVCFLNTKKNGP